MEDSEMIVNPLFGALTRPALTAGVTLEVFGINLIIAMSLLIATGNLLYALCYVPLHIVGWQICRIDPHFFNVLKANFALPNQPNKSIWVVRCYEPF